MEWKSKKMRSVVLVRFGPFLPFDCKVRFWTVPYVIVPYIRSEIWNTRWEYNTVSWSYLLSFIICTRVRSIWWTYTQYKHTHTHVHACTYVRTCVWAHTNTNVGTHIHTQHASMHRHARNHTHACANNRTHKYIHICTFAYTSTHIHTHTQTHTQCIYTGAVVGGEADAAAADSCPHAWGS